MKVSSLQYIGMIVFAVLLGGCGISVDNLIPSTPSVPSPRFTKTLKVHPVTGAKESFFGGPAMVTDEEYTEGLVRTLKQSKLFQGVVTDKVGDYELITKILAHGQDKDLANATLAAKHAMIVEYQIVDAQSKNKLWKKGFNSRHEVTFGQSFFWSGSNNSGSGRYCKKESRAIH